MEAVPRSLFSRDYEILENSKKIADIDMSVWRERADVLIDNNSYSINKEGFINPVFSLEENGTTLASATKESILRHGFVIEVAGSRFYLRRKSWYSARAMSLTNDIAVIGTITPKSFFSRGAAVNLPHEITLPVKVFIVWLVLILWKRDRNAGAGGAGDGG